MVGEGNLRDDVPEPGLEPGEKEERREQPEKEELEASMIEDLVDWVAKNPRVAFHNPTVSALLEYISRKKPKFSKSKLVSSIVEKELKKMFPEEYEKIAKAIEKIRKRK